MKIVAEPVADRDGQRVFWCELQDEGMVVWAAHVVTDEAILVVAPTVFRDIFNKLSKDMIEIVVEQKC